MMVQRKVLWSLGAGVVLALGIVSCGGESTAPPAETSPEPPPSAATHRSHVADDGPFTGPEYDGDHTLPGDPIAGEAVYRGHCIACHGADGHGNGGLTGADFVRDHRRLAKNNDTLLRSIRDGIPNMPAMPAHATLLTETERRDALSYIRVTFGPAPAAPVAAAAATP